MFWLVALCLQLLAILSGVLIGRARRLAPVWRILLAAIAGLFVVSSLTIFGLVRALNDVARAGDSTAGIVATNIGGQLLASGLGAVLAAAAAAATTFLMQRSAGDLAIGLDVLQNRGSDEFATPTLAADRRDAADQIHRAHPLDKPEVGS